MIRLVHFSLRPGGIEVLIPVFTKAISHYSFCALVIRKPVGLFPNVYDWSEIEYKVASSKRFNSYFNALLYFIKHRNDVFHAFNVGPVILALMRLAGIKKIIYSIHGTIYWKKPSQRIVKILFWKLSLSQNMIIAANSNYSKKRFMELVSCKYNIELLYNPIDITKFSPLQEGRAIKRDYLKIIYVGRLACGKNLHRWLEIAAFIRTQKPSIRFEIWGDGVLIDELIHHAGELALNDVLIFKGYTENVAECYRNADLLLFLSEYESFGNVIVESILCGTPVIASAIPSMEEIFHNFPEFLVELDENLMDSVLKKINELDSLCESVPQAMAEFRERFSLQQHVEKLQKLYKHFDK